MIGITETTKPTNHVEGNNDTNRWRTNKAQASQKAQAINAMFTQAWPDNLHRGSMAE